MTTSVDRYRSEYLTEDRMRTCILGLHRVTHTLLGDATLSSMYGVGAKLHTDLCFQPMSVSTATLEWFIRDTLEQGIIVPGHSDLWFWTPDEHLQIKFCHEQDIHVNGSDEELLQRFLKSSPFSEVKFVACENQESSQQSIGGGGGPES